MFICICTQRNDIHPILPIPRCHTPSFPPLALSASKGRDTHLFYRNSNQPHGRPKRAAKPLSWAFPPIPGILDLALPRLHHPCTLSLRSSCLLLLLFLTVAFVSLFGQIQPPSIHPELCTTCILKGYHWPGDSTEIPIPLFYAEFSPISEVPRSFDYEPS